MYTCLKSEDLGFDLLKTTSFEQALEEGYSSDAYHFSKIARYCLHDASDDPFSLSIVGTHGLVSECWTALESAYVTRSPPTKRMSVSQLKHCRLDCKEKPGHLLERIERTSAELERLEMPLPPNLVLSFYVSAFRHQCDEIKKQFGGRKQERRCALYWQGTQR